MVFQVNLARTGNALKWQDDFHIHRLQLPLGVGYLQNSSNELQFNIT